MNYLNQDNEAQCNKVIKQTEEKLWGDNVLESLELHKADK